MAKQRTPRRLVRKIVANFFDFVPAATRHLPSPPAVESGVPRYIEQVRPQLRAVGIIRLSTSAQAAIDRAGKARQEASIKAICVRENLECVEVVYIIDVSGAEVLKDNQLRRTLGLVADGSIDGVVVDAFDRLCRTTNFADLAILQSFQDRPTAKVWTATQTFDFGQNQSLLLPGLHALIAGDELAKIRSRVHGAKEAKRRRSECPSNSLTLPLGVSVHSETRKLFYNDEHLIVREIFDLFAVQGIRNYTEISRRIAPQKIVTSATVRNLLTNPIYTGWRVYSQRRGKKKISRTGKTYRQKEDRALEDVIRAKVLDPIVSEEMFERVQRMIAQTRFNHVERRKARENCHLGTGIVRCGYCDSPLYCPTTRSHGNRRGYYMCKRNYYMYRPDTGGCPQCNLRAEDVDRAIYDFTLHTLSDPERLALTLEAALRRLNEVIQPFPSAFDPDDEIEKLHRKDSRLLDAYASGVMHVEELREKRKEIAVRVAHLKLVARPQRPAVKLDVGDLVRRVVTGVSILPKVTASRTRKEIVHAMFSELRLKDKAITGFKLHEDFALPGVAGGNLEVMLDTPFPVCVEPEILPEGQRRCSACNKVQVATSFHPRKLQCRSCIAVRSRERYLRRKAQAR